MATRTPILSALAFALSATAGFAQAPANDDCIGATMAIVGLNPFDSTMATDGTGLALNPAVCDMGMFGDEQIHADVWFTFTAPSTGLYDFETINSGTPYDGRMAVYNQGGCPDDPANVIGCDDDSGPGVEPAIFNLALTMGSNYIVRVGSYAPTTLEQPASLSIFTPPPPPANDDCGTAAVVMAGITPMDTTWATDGTGLALDPVVCDMGTFGDDQIYQDVWFSFTPAVTDFYDIAVINNGNTTFDSRIAIYNQNTCPDDPLNVIGCDDDDGPGLEALATGVSVMAGQTVLIRAGSYSGTTTEQPSALSIGVGPPPPTPPANDDCGNATPLTMFGTYAYDNVLATTDGPDLTGICDFGVGDNIAHNDVWFEYTPTVGGCTYISSFGLAGFDNKIAIYNTSTCPVDPNTVLACSDEEQQPIATPYEAGMDVTLTAGVTYLIQIGNFSSTGAGVAGSFQIAAGPLAVGNLGMGEMQTGSAGCAAGPAFNEFCFGDGGNQAGCTNCPCTNNAPIGSGGGCLNSGGDGIQLLPSGDTSVSLPSGDSTDLRFGADGAPSGAFCILNSGDAVAPGNMANPCFGMNSGAQAVSFDGLRCAITNTRRHGGRSADVNGDVGVTNNPWGGEGGPPVGIAVAGGGFAAGQTRFFQIINRDDALAVCMRGLNTSQAVEVTFTP